ncbi:hypothetical protein Hanom_Chr13g01197321 [Helianthus anomalus]
MAKHPIIDYLFVTLTKIKKRHVPQLTFTTVPAIKRSILISLTHSALLVFLNDCLKETSYRHQDSYPNHTRTTPFSP